MFAMDIAGRDEDIIDQTHALLDQMEPLAAGLDAGLLKQREQVLEFRYRAALRLQQWESCLEVSNELRKLQATRSDSELRQAQTRLRDWHVLVELGRVDEARNLLESQRQIILNEGRMEDRAAIWRAIACVDDLSGSYASAIRCEATSLSFWYQVGSADECVQGHANIANLMSKIEETNSPAQQELVLAHWVAAALIDYRSNSTRLRPHIKRLSECGEPDFDKGIKWLTAALNSDPINPWGNRFLTFVKQLSPRTDLSLSLSSIWQHVATDQTEQAAITHASKIIPDSVMEAVNRSDWIETAKFTSSLEPDERSAAETYIVELGAIKEPTFHVHPENARLEFSKKLGRAQILAQLSEDVTSALATNDLHALGIALEASQQPSQLAFSIRTLVREIADSIDSDPDIAEQKATAVLEMASILFRIPENMHRPLIDEQFIQLGSILLEDSSEVQEDTLKQLKQFLVTRSVLEGCVPESRLRRIAAGQVAAEAARELPPCLRDAVESFDLIALSESLAAATKEANDALIQQTRKVLLQQLAATDIDPEQYDELVDVCLTQVQFLSNLTGPIRNALAKGKISEIGRCTLDMSEEEWSSFAAATNQLAADLASIRKQDQDFVKKCAFAELDIAQIIAELPRSLVDSLPGINEITCTHPFRDAVYEYAGEIVFPTCNWLSLDTEPDDWHAPTIAPELTGRARVAGVFFVFFVDRDYTQFGTALKNLSPNERDHAKKIIRKLDEASLAVGSAAEMFGTLLIGGIGAIEVEWKIEEIKSALDSNDVFAAARLARQLSDDHRNELTHLAKIGVMLGEQQIDEGMLICAVNTSLDAIDIFLDMPALVQAVFKEEYQNIAQFFTDLPPEKFEQAKRCLTQLIEVGVRLNGGSDAVAVETGEASATLADIAYRLRRVIFAAVKANWIECAKEIRLFSDEQIEAICDAAKSAVESLAEIVNEGSSDAELEEFKQNLDLLARLACALARLPDNVIQALIACNVVELGLALNKLDMIKQMGVAEIVVEICEIMASTGTDESPESLVRGISCYFNAVQLMAEAPDEVSAIFSKLSLFDADIVEEGFTFVSGNINEFVRELNSANEETKNAVIALLRDINENIALIVEGDSEEMQDYTLRRLREEQLLLKRVEIIHELMNARVA